MESGASMKVVLPDGGFGTRVSDITFDLTRGNRMIVYNQHGEP